MVVASGGGGSVAVVAGLAESRTAAAVMAPTAVPSSSSSAQSAARRQSARSASVRQRASPSSSSSRQQGEHMSPASASASGAPTLYRNLAEIAASMRGGSNLPRRGGVCGSYDGGNRFAGEHTVSAASTSSAGLDRCATLGAVRDAAAHAICAMRSGAVSAMRSELGQRLGERDEFGQRLGDRTVQRQRLGEQASAARGGQRAVVAVAAARGSVAAAWRARSGCRPRSARIVGRRESYQRG